MGKPRVIYWFRTDLRLHDNPALQAALELEPAVLWPVFTWDPHYVYRARGGLNRWQYLLDCQNDLSASITKLNAGSKLFVLREAPQTVFSKVFAAWGVTHLAFEKDTDTYGRERDEAVVKAAQEAGVEVVTRLGRTLWDPEEVVRKNGGKPTMSITQLMNAADRIGQVPKPIDAPTNLPGPGDMPLEFEQTVPEFDLDVNAKWRQKDGLGNKKHGTAKDESYKSLAGPKGDFAIETLQELGFDPQKATTPHRGGETLALKQLESIVSDTHYAATFRKPLTSPAALAPQSTTLLSPHLHFGSLSVRLFYWRVREALDKYAKSGKKDGSTPPESLIGQLFFRDMYFAAQAGVGPSFGQTVGNGHVRFVPWHLPSKLDDRDMATFEYEVDSQQAETWLKRWELGKTGFPWIDALMRQLRQEGWIHHLGRHSLACFLTRGGCYIHWERGLGVFEELLLDHEPACNAGNWQWLSCTAFFAQYYRCYSPVSFPTKWDKSGDFVRRWCPELARLDAKYIYEPWRAPMADQQTACLRLVDLDESCVEKDMDKGTYPNPMFDFAERRKVCIASLKKAYHAGLFGDDAKVKDGSWTWLFKDGGDGDGHDRVQSSDDGVDANRAGDDDEAGIKRTSKRGRRRSSSTDAISAPKVRASKKKQQGRAWRR